MILAGFYDHDSLSHFLGWSLQRINESSFQWCIVSVYSSSLGKHITTVYWCFCDIRIYSLTITYLKSFLLNYLIIKANNFFLHFLLFLLDFHCGWESQFNFFQKSKQYAAMSSRQIKLCQKKADINQVNFGFLVNSPTPGPIFLQGLSIPFQMYHMYLFWMSYRNIAQIAFQESRENFVW